FRFEGVEIFHAGAQIFAGAFDIEPDNVFAAVIEICRVHRSIEPASTFKGVCYSGVQMCLRCMLHVIAHTVLLLVGRDWRARREAITRASAGVLPRASTVKRLSSPSPSR